MISFQLKDTISMKDILGNANNVAEILSEHDLENVGRFVKEGFDSDERTREGWVQQQEEMLKLTLQVYEKKMTPWPNAANVKFPLLTLAAIRFGATAYPALVDSIMPVKFITKGEDNEGAKMRRAIRLGMHMSYQLTEEMEDWEEDTDKALLIASIHGCAFKKTYHDDVDNKNISELVLPKDFVTDFWTRNIKTSNRYTHVMEVDCNFIYEQQAAGVFLDMDLPDASQWKVTERSNLLNAHASGEMNAAEQTYIDTPRLLLEQYTYMDLDGDGYKEPYIISVDYDTAQVLRIVPRFDADGVYVSSKNKKKILRIDPEEYFTKIPFIPSPDGSFYDIGFGVLLGSINKAANTILNQLLDAGTLSNRQAGFLAKGIRIKGGNTNFNPGEWKIVETIASTLKDSIVPLPVRDPSTVLYQLLVFLLDAGNKLGSTVDMMVGENPGQNQPATTTMAVLQQGLKVFIAIHKRMFKAFKEEYQKLYRLNKKYVDINDYLDFVDPTDEERDEAQSDYQGPSNDVRPNADANVITEMQRVQKAQALLQLLPLGLNHEEVTRRVLVSQKQEDIDSLMKPNPNPPQDPKITLQAQKQHTDMLLKAAELVLKHMDSEAVANKDAAQALQFLAQARLATAQANSLDENVDLSKVDRHLEMIKLAQENEEKEEEAEVKQELGGGQQATTGGGQND